MIETALTGSTAFVLAGGGTKGSFEVGALQYLVGTERIIPDIITATSAGAVAASVLAQARTLEEFVGRVQEVEDDILAMTRTEQIFGEQAWLRALEGTALGGEIRFALTEGTRPPQPALESTGIDGALLKAPDVAPAKQRSPQRAAKKLRRRRRRKIQRMLVGAAFRLPGARRKFRTSGERGAQPPASGRGHPPRGRERDPSRRPGTGRTARVAAALGRDRVAGRRAALHHPGRDHRRGRRGDAGAR